MSAPDHRRLDCRACAPDVLAHLVQSLEEHLAGDSELLGECAHTDLGQNISCFSRSVPWVARTVVTTGKCSLLSTHRALISVKPAFGSLGTVNFGVREAADVCRDAGDIDRCADSQRTTERPTTHGVVTTRDRGMQPGAAPPETVFRIDDHGHRTPPAHAVGGGDRGRSGDHSQKCRPAIRAATTDARSDRPGEGGRASIR